LKIFTLFYEIYYLAILDFKKQFCLIKSIRAENFKDSLGPVKKIKLQWRIKSRWPPRNYVRIAQVRQTKHETYANV
jgi:hypothetical protein